ncbi:ATP-binding protein [Gemmatimonas sp. UBA7669]|uniref:ATP-binding protein n=1 Tax=Gemmatimonas sp. UBA7669 TaxID=1946568 RepID=UPI0025C27BFB|nr:ATP-binding protein [Gemmatimonas sp. UBA7669]
MTTVIAVPPSLDEQSFEQVFEQLAPVPDGEKLLIDARHARWASPYGLAALLCVAQSRHNRADFAVPENPDTLSYWSRTGFFRHAAELYDLHGSVPREREAHESDVLLELTPITRTDDVHGVVGRIQQKAADILHGQLNLDTAVTGAFGMTLSESCQNIVEHAGLGGWVAVQTYRYTKRLGRRVVVIAVCDAGVGFRKSLESSPSHRHSDRWDDAMALEDAVLRAVSRFRHGDKGRGQGLAGIRRFVGRWEGKLTVRSGTARLAITPDWDEDVPMTESLPYFPGAQMQIVIPERLGDAPVRARGTATRSRTGR